MGKKRPLRRELLPLAKLQLKLVTLVCLPIVLTCIIVTVLQTFFFITSVQPRLAAHGEFSRQIIMTAIRLAAIPLLVMVPILALAAIWASHRILGPMRRLETRLKAIARGCIGRGFHFRLGDELTFVADAVAEMEDGLRERLQTCKNASTEAELRASLNAFELAEDKPVAEPDQSAA
ncbi:MAG: hypothetical protein ABIG68_11760 [Acidobacteriota bacterium]